MMDKPLSHTIHNILFSTHFKQAPVRGTEPSSVILSQTM